MKIIFIFSCSGMFRNVPCVPGFIDAPFQMRLGMNCLCRVCFYGFIHWQASSGMLLSVHKDLQLQLPYYYALFTSIATC